MNYSKITALRRCIAPAFYSAASFLDRTVNERHDPKRNKINNDYDQTYHTYIPPSIAAIAAAGLRWHSW